MLKAQQKILYIGLKMLENFLMILAIAIVANIFFYVLNPKKYMEINEKIDEFINGKDN